MQKSEEKRVKALEELKEAMAKNLTATRKRIADKLAAEDEKRKLEQEAFANHKKAELASLALQKAQHAQELANTTS
jgi:23S rRNA G2445 N2-methylase RlmL